METLALSNYEDIVQLALAEDVGAGDVTSSATIPDEATATATMVFKVDGVVCGLDVAETVFHAIDPALDVTFMGADGDSVAAGTVVMVITGSARAILTAERVALNFVQRLSGVASQTRKLVDAIAGTAAQLTDTRKTTPGMRVLEKYAVRCGGGYSHRMGLHDAVLIKDNHLAGVESGAALCEFVAAASRRARTTVPAPSFVEVEVDTLAQFESLLSLPKGTVDIVLLDNMGPEQLRRAAAMRDERSPSLQLEASGGITLETLATIAATGVDRISSGALTHSAVQLDFGLDIEEKPVDRRP